MKLSIIIVNYNVSHFLEQTLLSIKKSAHNLALEIIVVDNNSVDKSEEMVKTKFPHVIFIKNNKNVGFSKANNQGIKIARGKYILLLNPDTVLQEDTLIKCCQFMETHPHAGGLGVMMLDGKGIFLPESKRGFPTPSVAFYKIFGLAALFPKSKTFGRYHLGFLDKHKTHEIDVLSGAFMFLRKEALDKVGNLDEDYFMYGEDIDLSYRISAGGYKNFYYPDTRIIHYKGESTKKTSLNYVFVFYKAMKIFAQKRFSKRGALIFTILINIAIYLRATLSLFIRFIKFSLLPAIDALAIYAGVYFLKDYYERNYKIENYYPSIYIELVVPTYIIIWLVTVYFSGGYDKSVKTSKIVRGILIGTLLISAISNFIESYRFSKALILAGSVWAIAALSISRIIYHFRSTGSLSLGESKKKRVVVVGNLEESKRAIQLLKNGNYSLEILGYITTNDKKDISEDLYLGSAHQLDALVRLYKVEELIFCSKDFSANQIIDWMMKINDDVIDFKIMPDDSNYIIGSNSKNTRGEFYTLHVELNIMQKSALRNKRVLDISLSFLFLITSPLLVLFIERPKNFFMNIFYVLNGKYTWVGFSSSITVALPKLKRGVITPVTHIAAPQLDQSTINKLNLLYAKNYSTSLDLSIILKSLKNLGV